MLAGSQEKASLSLVQRLVNISHFLQASYDPAGLFSKWLFQSKYKTALVDYSQILSDHLSTIGSGEDLEIPADVHLKQAINNLKSNPKYLETLLMSSAWNAISSHFFKNIELLEEANSDFMVYKINLELSTISLDTSGGACSSSETAPAPILIAAIQNASPGTDTEYLSDKIDPTYLKSLFHLRNTFQKIKCRDLKVVRSRQACDKFIGTLIELDKTFPIIMHLLINSQTNRDLESLAIIIPTYISWMPSNQVVDIPILKKIKAIAEGVVKNRKGMETKEINSVCQQNRDKALERLASIAVCQEQRLKYC